MRQPRYCWTFLLPLAVSLIVTVCTDRPAHGADNTALARKVKAILRANCYKCHGENGTNEGGFNYLLDRGQLVSRNKVVPGKHRQSKLFRKVSSGEMPPEMVKKPRPTRIEIALLKEWIEEGAADFNRAVGQRDFISPADQLGYIRADLEKLPKHKRSSARYFTITHLYNAGLTDDQLQSYRHGLSKLINSLSWARDIGRPKSVDPAQTVLRIDLDDFDWNEKVWDRILETYPYGVTYGSPTAKFCYAATKSRLPYVHADWFVFAASRPPLYHDLLHLPMTDRELEKEMKVDVADNIRLERVARAGFNGSGVSRNNRLLERHKSGNGAYWKSYDFAGSAQTKNLFAHPLGPAGENAFQHDGGEIIFSLPNGLQGYMLVDGQGNRIDKGPINSVSVKNRANPTVINGISCMGCHAKGMIEKEDQIRSHVLSSSEGFTDEEKEKILTMYLPRKDFLAWIRQDAERYRKAVEKTGAPLAATEPVAALAARFEDEIDLKLAAAEAGVPVSDFLNGLRSRKLARDLGLLKVEGATVKREVFQRIFGQVIADLQRDGTWLLPENALAKRAFNEGKRFLANHLYDRALAKITEAIRLNPKLAVAYQQRGWFYFHRTPDFPRAIADCTKALSLDSNCVPALITRGDAYDGAHQKAKALADYRRALRILRPKTAEEYRLRGAAYAGLARLGEGDYEPCLHDFSRAIQLDPKLGPAFVNRAWAYYSKKEYDQAIADCNRAIQLTANDSWAYHCRGCAYHRKRDYAEALADFDKAVNIDPKYTWAYCNRGWVHRDRGTANNNTRDYIKAIAEYSKALRINPDFAHAYNGRGWAHDALKQYNEAIEDYNTTIRLDPNFADAYNGRGWTFRNQKKYGKAIKEFNKAIHLDPNAPWPYNNRGVCYKETKKNRRALADYNRALRLDSTVDWPYSNRGNVYFAWKKYRRAIADYTRAIRVNSKNPVFYENRATAYGKIGKKAKARADRRKARALKQRQK